MENKPRSEDRRVRRTKKLLTQALTSLMKEKQIKDITVKELTDDADVNRSTFYFHYQDVNSMVSEMENNFFNDFLHALDAIEQKSHDAITILFECLRDHMELCRILLGANGDMGFVEKMKKIVETKCSAIWEQAVPGMGESDRNVLDSFLIGGVLSTIQAWVMQDEGRQEPGEISQVLNRLIFDGICPVVAQW